MRDGRDIQRQAGDVQKELNTGGLSRRVFLDRLKGFGVGFGAAYVLGLKGAAAGVRAEEVVSLGSTHPALNGIIEEGRQALDPGPAAQGGDPQVQTASSGWGGGYGGTPGGSGGGYGGTPGGGSSGGGWGGSGGGYGGESPYSRAQYSRGYARGYERYARTLYQRYARSYERWARPPYERYARGYDRVY